ncbi:chorismate synthase, putative [Eimeria acervulina]|uniref:chorismate synthase n=1 Tax=Eimeria acervulina TaxID=5801 RepID=U6GFI1_EIMAC|nr:chorismate synthase, putative [Eimeria acervulina]CDI78950.1 chorismate synthase, putative [Eimeria acervulina]
MSTFGTSLRVSTFGESHGAAVGCIIDGLPGGLPFCLSCVQRELQRRRSPAGFCSTSRSEEDRCQVLSGVENNFTLGTPIALLIPNKDVRKEDYRNIGAGGTAAAVAAAAAAAAAPAAAAAGGHLQCIPRPGHADLTYLLKYGIGSSSGGGRSSAREPVFDKLPAVLAHAMFSIPAVKGFEIGKGFEAAKMRGSAHNDIFINKDKQKHQIAAATGEAAAAAAEAAAAEAAAATDKVAEAATAAAPATATEEAAAATAAAATAAAAGEASSSSKSAVDDSMDCPCCCAAAAARADEAGATTRALSRVQCRWWRL